MGLHMDLLDRRDNVLAFGNPGSGKTHLLCAIGQELIARGRRMYFTTSALLVQDLLVAKRDLATCHTRTTLAACLKRSRNTNRGRLPSCTSLSRQREEGG